MLKEMKVFAKDWKKHFKFQGRRRQDKHKGIFAAGKKVIHAAENQIEKKAFGRMDGESRR